MRRFFDSMRRINHKKEYKKLEETYDYKSEEALKRLDGLNIEFNFDSTEK